MKTLEDLAAQIAAAMSRSYRRLARWTWRRLVDATNAFKVLIIFAPFIYVAGIGHELTHSLTRPLWILGWLLMVGSLSFMIWMLVELRRSASEEATPEATYLWLVCTVITIIIVFAITAVHHEFQSPILAGTQQLPTVIRNVFRAAPDFDNENNNDSVAAPMSSHDEWPRIKTTSAAAKDEETHLGLWVEKVHLSPSETILSMACQTWFVSESATLHNSDGAYMVDEKGHKYGLKKDQGRYSLIQGERTIEGGEIYRWTLVFPRIGVNRTMLKVNHPQFNEVDVIFLQTVPAINTSSVPLVQQNTAGPAMQERSDGGSQAASTTAPTQSPPPDAAQPAAQAAKTDAAASPDTTSAEPHPGTYLHVTSVELPAAEAVVRMLRERGYRPFLWLGPNGRRRVLVGPYDDTTVLGKAKADLENLGFNPYVTRIGS